MVIQTKYLGEMEIVEDKIIYFESGLPGFSNENKFVILDIPGNDMIQILQSIQTAELAFMVTNPHYFYQNYHFKLDEHIIETLQITEEKDIVVLSIMTIQEPFHLSTINLQAPLLINLQNKRAKQFILPHDTYEVKAKISSPAINERGV